MRADPRRRRARRGAQRSDEATREVDLRVGDTAPIVAFTVDGVAVMARPGETIAAALLAAGVRTLRRTRGGAPRGLFCGIGACFDCLVTVDGGHPRRACLTTVRPGAAVVTADDVIPPAAPAAPQPGVDGPGGAAGD